MLLELCGPKEEQHRFVWAAGDQDIVLYVDDRQIAGRNPIWVQTMRTEVVRIFEIVLLQTNLVKTKTMVCNPGFIWN